MSKWRRRAVRILATAVAVSALVSAACSSGGGSPDNSGTIDEGRPGIRPSTSGAAPVVACPVPGGYTATSVQVGLIRTFQPTAVVSFGVPLADGAPDSTGAYRVTLGGQPLAATVVPLLRAFDPDGKANGLRSVLVQFPSSALQGACTVVEVRWDGEAPTGGSSPAAPRVPFREVSVASEKVVQLAERTIERKDGVATLVETKRVERVLYTAREPALAATFPDGYLGATGILGPVVSRAGIGQDYAGLAFVSDFAAKFGLSAMFEEPYALNPDAVVGPDDLDESRDVTGYEAWLYDRCTTFLTFFAHNGDTRFLREGLRSCSYYAEKIELSGEHRGIFKGKPEPDSKYSHVRGLYAYYALTGDEAALDAAKAMADFWYADEDFTLPYREGRLRGPDKLWTERLLGTSIEGLYYGFLMTGEERYLQATKELVATTHTHVTTGKAGLAKLNPGSDFPPQDCLIHNASQAAEGDEDEPFCSGWMAGVLLVGPLLAYFDQTADPRVDEIFIRLARHLRDSGSSYLKGDVLPDTFLRPSKAYDPAEDELDRRILVPLYGSGIDAQGKLRQYGEYDDFQHCLDATALTAAALASLRRTGGFDKNPAGPFPSEGESFVALHHEFSFCAYVSLRDATRPNRDPSRATAEDLAEGLADPQKYIAANKIGYETHSSSPQRRVSWWFNTSLLAFGLLRDAGVPVPELRPGAVQP